MGQLNDPSFHLSGGTFGTINDMSRQTGLFQSFDHAAQALFAASRRGAPNNLPTTFAGNTGDDVSISALADHQRGIELPVIPERPNGCEELLVPGT
jgi:hypothetical protein